LIDDEKSALEMLAIKIGKIEPAIKVIAKTQLPTEGINLINELNPNLVFLDITMPVLSGFDVLAQLENPDVEVIFVTAHNDYAIEAIQHCAIGYIVKPIDEEDLQIAIHNALQNLEKKSSLEKARKLLENIKNDTKNTLVVPTQKGFSFLKIDKIIRFEGVDGYTRIHTDEGKPLLSSYNIGKFFRMLENHSFFAVHKSHLVNLYKVKTYLNEGFLELQNGDLIPVSKSNKNEVLQALAML